MASAAQPIRNQTEETPVELQELLLAVEALPARQRESLQPALARVIECSTRRRRILNLVQEALSQLRLDMKYLVFDLEATRRERDQLRQQIDGSGDMGDVDGLGE
ncbi:transcriptional regulator [Planctomycetaceae bacterium SH139]|jgi:nitric oxide reductase activation protein